jgi:hypothetical protein
VRFATNLDYSQKADPTNATNHHTLGENEIEKLLMHITMIQSLISGLCRDVDEICGRLGYYAASCGNCLPTFRDNVSVPSSRAKSPSRKESQPIT